MNAITKRFAMFAAAGGLGVGGCALVVLLMAQEPMRSIFFLKFLSISTGSGLFLGCLAAVYTHCSQHENLAGIGNAIFLSVILLAVGALCVGALEERPSISDRRFILWVAACTVAWWLSMLLAGIARLRGARWGSTIQALLVGTPILAVLVGSLYSVAAQSPEPGSLWGHWNGTRLVGLIILAPVCGVGLLLCLLDTGLVYLVGALALALMGGAVVGELFLGSLGWPVAGAFAGGFVCVSALGWLLGRFGTRRYGKQSD